jgi:hypothetical protein
MDTTKLKGNFILQNQKGDLDTLVLLQCGNVIQTQSYKSMTNIEECGHTISFNYDSKKGFGTVSLWLQKDENENYTVLINGFCFDKELVMNEKNILKDSLITIKVDECDNSSFKEIAVRNLKFEYFITRDDNVWKPIEFISGNPLYD